MATRDERGAVTAEAAIVIPVLVIVAIALCWLVSLGVTQVRVVDAAREAARSMARDDDPDSAIAWGRRVAPDQARFTIEEDDDTVTVTVSASVRGPGGVLDALPGFEARATAVAAREQGP